MDVVTWLMVPPWWYGRGKSWPAGSGYLVPCSDAERRLKNVEGIDQIINDIEVLPVSPNDDRIRLAVARNIYRSDALDRYGFQTQPSIRIIVKQGRVTLEGVVDSEADKAVAAIKAREVSGVFEVKNNLSVAK